MLTDILKNQFNLKRLNLTQTQVNDQVLLLIANTCNKLEEISLRDCKSIYDDCLSYLTNKLSKHLVSLNVDYVYLSDECIRQILIECIYLKFFYTDNLIRVIHSLFNGNIIYKLNLETIYCDNSQIYMHEEQFQALKFTCPKLKSLHISCFGTNEILKTLTDFEELRELLISNQTQITYKFDNYLTNYFVIHGKLLKRLHLIHINDVNLRHLIENCENLSELIIEFVHYYMPACANNIDYELTEIEQNMLPELRYLRTVSISNSNCTTKNPYLNIDLFKFDLKLLIRKAVNLVNLKLERFNFINNTFFNDLINFSLQSNAKSIEKIELIKLNQLGWSPIKYLLFDIDYEDEDVYLGFENNYKNLKKINIFDCKLISKKNYDDAKYYLKKSNLNCEINWS